MALCTQCKSRNPDQSLFCNKCGASLTVASRGVDYADARAPMPHSPPSLEPRPPRVAATGSGCGRKLFGLGMFAFWFFVFPAFFLYIFGFSMKTSDEYECAMEKVSKSKTVKKHIGRPVEPGLFVWLSSSESSSNRSESYFGTSLKGPKGEGYLNVASFRSPIGSRLSLRLEVGDEEYTLYDGDWPCD